jgi:hypothetical protein
LIQNRSRDSLQKIEWQKKMLREKPRLEKISSRKKGKIVKDEGIAGTKKKITKKREFKNGDDLFNYYSEQ